VVLALVACGGGGRAPESPASRLTLQLSPESTVLIPDGTPASVEVTVTRLPANNRSVTLRALQLPEGVTAGIESPGTGNSGRIVFTAVPRQGQAGTHKVAITAEDGVLVGRADLELVVAVLARVGTSPEKRLELFMSTSFQPASWSDDFFVRHPEATEPLDALQPQHIRLQALELDIPLKTCRPNLEWNFQFLDRIVNPVFSVADNSPQFQIARGPDCMYEISGAGMRFRDPSYQEFAEYAANLVRYYNTSNGIEEGECVTSDPGGPCTSPSGYPITWWGIYNEPNINDLTPDEYVELYNTVVPAMQAVDPNIKFVAVELADFGTEPQRYMPTFIQKVTAQVDAVATHYYSSCNQRDSDQQLFDTIPYFAQHVSYIYSQLQSAGPPLADVPVWVTENNVNADFDKGGGISMCNGTPFVTDKRGSSAFFAAWRPTVFSQLAKAGARSLHHWGFAADAQYGEVDGWTAKPYLSYWVDYWLTRFLGYRIDTGQGAWILDLTVSDSRTVEILAAQKDADGSLVVMIANHAVRMTGDNNGPGAPRTVMIDLSDWGQFSSARLLTLDARTNIVTGPSAVSISPEARIPVTLDGYGVSFLELK